MATERTNVSCAAPRVAKRSMAGGDPGRSNPPTPCPATAPPLSLDAASRRKIDLDSGVEEQARAETARLRPGERHGRRGSGGSKGDEDRPYPGRPRRDYAMLQKKGSTT